MKLRLAVLAALAATGSAEAGVTLTGSRIAVGVNEDGSLCDEEREVCLFYDPDGMGRGAPLGNDVLRPGRSFEAWAATWTVGGETQSVRASAPYQGTGLSLTWGSAQQREDLLYVEGSTSQEGLDIALAIDLPEDGEVFWTTFVLTATRDVRGVELARTFDFDPDVYSNGGYATWNEAADGIAVSSSRNNGGKALALAVVDGEAGLCAWCSAPADVRAGTEGIRDGDSQLGVAWGPVDLAAGERVRVRFAYALGTDSETARERVRQAMLVDDLDGDGQTELEGDCDDRDPDTASGAPERADGRDNDCDDAVDEDTVVSDDDGDGFSEVEGDCDDANAAVFPGAPPVGEVSDADCDGLADEDAFDQGGRPATWDDEAPTTGGCSATASPVSPALALALLPLLLLRRRR